MNTPLLIAVGAASLCFGLFVYLLGFGDWYDKRLLDCTPVSRCRSVALGTVVVSGKASGSTPIPSLIGHLPCYISKVVVEEYRSSGKSSSWHTVHKRELRMPFFVEDATGSIKIEPERAELWLEPDIKYSSKDGLAHYSEAASERSVQVTETLDTLLDEYCLTRGINARNPIRFTETNLSPGDPVFVYGTASLNTDHSSECETIIRKTFWQTPYILEGDRSVMLTKLRSRGFLRILVGSALCVSGSAVLARASSSDAIRQWPDLLTSDVSLSAEIASVFALIALGFSIYVALIYNGLISLRNEVDRAFSNIDVLLQQRFDLIPNLVSVCKAYMQHESGVMQAVAASRGQWSTARGRFDKLAAAATSIEPLRQLLASADAYPRLRANENFLQLQGALTSIEDQIADRRELYNSAVSLFNSRIQIFPDRLIANAFRFSAQPFFSAEAPAGTAPTVDARASS